jgi:flavin reductase (DIM6/NTAB) family NADH-FMN oxidoreductase RutF
MTYVNVPFTKRIAETLAVLEDPGLLLVTAGRDGEPNIMTIGWGTIGTIWSKPIFTVLVRPSRFSYRLLEEGSSFTVCLPTPAMRQVAEFCGSKSGRSYDKFRELKLEPLPSTQISAPGIAGCPLIYECQAVHTNDVQPERVAADIQEQYYPQGDYHRVYFGHIVAVRALQDQGRL